MGFFSDTLRIVTDPVQSVLRRVGDVAGSGLLGPGVQLIGGLVQGDGLTSTLAGLGGSSGPAGMPGQQAADNFVAGRLNVGAGVGAGGFVAQATAINATLGAILASGGIHPAPTGNIKATVVILLRPDGAGFIDSVERGTPDIMSRDMQITKKTIKRIGKLGRKLPRKSVTPSLSAQINEKVKRKILSDVDCNNPLRLMGGDHCG